MGIGERIAQTFGAEDAAGFLMPGERQLATYAANALVAEGETIAWIRTRHFATNRGAALGLTAEALRQVGRTAASGGLLSLTNYRLLFVAHRLNVHTGHFSVFLPTIESADREATELGAQLTVLTHTMAYLFKVADATAVGHAIAAARAAVAPADVEQMRQDVHAHPERVGDGLRRFWRADAPGLREEELMARVRAAGEARRLEEVFGVLNVVELLHPEWRAAVLDLLDLPPAP